MLQARAGFRPCRMLDPLVPPCLSTTVRRHRHITLMKVLIRSAILVTVMTACVIFSPSFALTGNRKRLAPTSLGYAWSAFASESFSGATEER